MLVISNLSFAIEGKPLFEGASVTIPAGHKVGIVGRNGTGKTTLFKLIKGQLAPDGGNIEVPSYFRIGGVEQEAPASDASLLDTVLAADTERAALLLEAESCEDANRIGEIYQRLEDIDAYTAEPRASSILAGLGFSQHAQARPCHEFSGGWRMRVALGAVLFSQPDLLLLDEPTNYLDLEGAYWLEQFLANYQKTALIISHDKELLNRSVNSILNLSHHSLTYYTGNYDQFDAERRAKLEQQHSMKRKQDAQRAHIQSFVDRFRAKASKARQAQSRLKQLERMQPIAALSENAVAGFSFPTPQALRPPLVTIEGGIVGYGEQPVLSRLNLRLDSDDRIALLGANGEGKSTLSKLIADRLPLMAGKAFKSGKLRVGFFAQHQLDELVEGESALQHILRLRAGDSEKSLRTRLASAGFNNDIVDMPVEKLSGGQKARLLMLIATIEAPHILILDEPTNHLDIESREALVLALNDYDGAVILVSHDTHLVEAVADRLWLVKDGAVTPFDGDMDEYKKLIMSSNRTSGNKTSASKANKRSKDKEGKSTTASAQSGSASAKKINPVKLKSEIRRLDSQIEILASQKSALEAEMLKTDFYSVNDSAEIALKTKTFSDITAQLEKAEESWLELQEQL
ncbi:MAG: ABC-F family ATP-binding cassette domain-containing protein [Alphaproteobacteria bacterium]|nr:ABC-F family ATP-binding cassette domain-containing protein [Alphaproteobacteria bacterium]MBL6776013.1 ABC-F family ATP-binding cassette domain-containing protein [Alphaproteobacteria bacterium]